MTGPLIGSLFTGYGGIDLGLRQLWPDAETAWVSDIKPGANKVLAHRFPGVKNLGDITTINWDDVEPVDIITGGSPCQDLSHAGKRVGMKEGTRSGLWRSMLEGIAALRPALVVWENVRGAFSAKADSGVEPCPGCVGDGEKGSVLRALGRVLGDLADIGYDTAWVGLRAADVGAPHGRFRVFVLAWPAIRHPGHDAGSTEHGVESEGAAGGLGEPNQGATNTERRAGEQWWLAASGETPRGWASADHRGRGGASDADPRSETLFEWPGLRQGEPEGVGRGQPARDGGETANLPTPRATDGTKGGPNQRGSSGDLMLPSAVAQLMPTPAVADGTGGHTSRSGARKGELMLPGLVRTLPAGDLLPTPAVNDMGAGKTVEAWDEWTDAMKERHANGNGHGKSLSIEAQRLLPTPQLSDTNGASEKPGEWEGRFQLRDIILPRVAEMFGQYAPAIQRWENVIEREAPSPVEPTGRDGGNRLSPRFVEWMMGLPDGWVTDTPNVTRNEALSLGGDGVVPQQCAAAVAHLIAVRAMYATSTDQLKKVTA